MKIDQSNEVINVSYIEIAKQFSFEYEINKILMKRYKFQAGKEFSKQN